MIHLVIYIYILASFFKKEKQKMHIDGMGLSSASLIIQEDESIHPTIVRIHTNCQAKQT